MTADPSVTAAGPAPDVPGPSVGVEIVEHLAGPVPPPSGPAAAGHG